MVSIQIPNPCSENWAAMHPKDNGRHCDSCCKVVVDFTQMDTAAIVNYINEHKDNKVCGHFRKDQIQQPVLIYSNSSNVLSKTKIFLAALYIVFGATLFSSCSEKISSRGRVSTNSNSLSSQQYQVGDTIVHSDNTPNKKSQNHPSNQCRQNQDSVFIEGEMQLVQGVIIPEPLITGEPDLATDTLTPQNENHRPNHDSIVPKNQHIEHDFIMGKPAYPKSE